MQVLETASHRETDDGVHSSVQFTLASDIMAFCNVSNEYGADAMTFHIKTSEFPVSVCPALVVPVPLYVSAPPPKRASPPFLVSIYVFALLCLVLSGLACDSRLVLSCVSDKCPPLPLPRVY